MKTTLFFVALCFSFTQARAAAPDCWTVDGSSAGKNAEGVELADGQFLVSVELAQITKDNLVTVLRKMQHGNLNARLQPTILEEFISFQLETVKSDAERDALKESINSQVMGILEVPGVSGVECNTITNPGDKS